MKKPTAAQVALAARYEIPLSQAGTINYYRSMEFMKWLKTPAAQIERWLDMYYLNMQVAQTKEWM